MKNKISLLLLLLSVFSPAFGQLFIPSDIVYDIEEKPELLWKFKAGPCMAAPVIDQETVLIGSLDSTLYALDLATGQKKWTLPTNGAIRSSVCVMPQRLFLLSSDGILYRLEKDSGKVDGIYRTMTGYMGDAPVDYADYFTSTPVISDSTIYFGCGSNIYAVSMTNGYADWVFSTGGAVHTTPAIFNGKLYAGSFDGHMYCIDLKTGTLVWKFKTTGNFGFPKGEVTGNPVVAGGKVFFGARDFHFYAVDVRGGFSVWLKQFPSGWALPATLNDSALYIGSSDDRLILAIDHLTGREYWKMEPGFNVFGGVAKGKNMGYVATLGGKLFGIDLRDGKTKWTIPSESYSKNRDKWLDKDEDLYRSDIGKVIDTPLDILKIYKELGGIFGTPAIAGDRIVVAGYDGWVCCYGIKPKK